VISPDGLSFVEWSDRSSIPFVRYGVVSKAEPGADWRVWANSLCALNDIRALQPPDPAAYDSWQEWVGALNVVLDLGV
jgi:hypothetical protein